MAKVTPDDVKEYEPECPKCQQNVPGSHGKIHFQIAKKRLEESRAGNPDIQN